MAHFKKKATCQCTDDGFDSRMYKLMKKSSYAFSKPMHSGCMIEARPYNLNDTQKMIQKQGQVTVPKIGLGYVPAPIRKDFKLG